MEPRDLPSIRRANLLQLFSEHVAQRMASAPSEQITGLDRVFAAMIQVHNTYFSGMKSGARTIGDKLARQIEQHCGKESGWLDEERQPTGLSPGEQQFLALALKTFRETNSDGRKRLKQLLKLFQQETSR